MWYEDRQASVKPSSLSMYEQRYHLHLEHDEITEKDIESLKNSDIQKFCNNVFSKYSRSYAKSIMNLLKSIVEYYYVYTDEPMRVYKIRYPSINLTEKKEAKTFSLIERVLLTDFCIKYLKRRCILGVLIALYTGLRIGEVCGLKWEDIDTARGQAVGQEDCGEINRQWQKHSPPAIAKDFLFCKDNSNQ